MGNNIGEETTHNKIKFFSFLSLNLLLKKTHISIKLAKFK